MKITAISGLLPGRPRLVVSAAPAKEETAARVSYTGQAKALAAPIEDWVELRRADARGSHGREYITVDGRFSEIRIAATRKGRPIVRSVRIVYADGKHKSVGSTGSS